MIADFIRSLGNLTKFSEFEFNEILNQTKKKIYSS